MAENKSKGGAAGLLAIAAGLAVAVGTAYAFVRGKSQQGSGSGGGAGTGGGSGGGGTNGGGVGQVTINPTIAIIDPNFNYISSGYYIPSNLTVSGNGFVPNGQVAIYDGSGKQLNATQADSNGNIYVSFALNGFNPAPGPAQITALDLTTGTYSNIQNISITAVSGSSGSGTSGAISPRISTATTTISSIAQDVVISGSGFTAKGIVHVSQYLNNNTALQATGFDVQADGSGNFTETTTPAASISSTKSIQYVAEDMVTTDKSNTLSISTVF